MFFICVCRPRDPDSRLVYLLVHLRGYLCIPIARLSFFGPESDPKPKKLIQWIQFLSCLILTAILTIETMKFELWKLRLLNSHHNLVL